MNDAKSRSNSQSDIITPIDWKEYNEIVDELCEKLNSYNFQAVYGIPRGGLIPAVIISHQFNIPLINGTDAPLCCKYDCVLIVDDIIDSGETLKKYSFNCFIIATLFKHCKCLIMPDVFVRTNSNWIRFPYEVD
jgi:uncharacterized protein